MAKRQSHLTLALFTAEQVDFLASAGMRVVPYAEAQFVFNSRANLLEDQLRRLRQRVSDAMQEFGVSIGKKVHP